MFRKIKKSIDKIISSSLRIKIILFILAIIIPSAIVSLFLFNYLTRTSVKVGEETLNETISLIKQDMIDSVSAKADIFDLSFKNITIDLEDIKNKIIDEGFQEKLLTDYYYKHQIISNIYFIDNSGLIFIFPSLDEFHQEKVDLSQIKELSFLASKDNIVYTGRWVGPYNDFKNKEKIMTYALPIWKGNKFIGAVLLDVPVASFFSEIVRINPSQSSYAFIARSTGEFIYSSEIIFDDFKIEKKENSNLMDSQILKEQNILDILSLEFEKNGIFQIENKNKGGQKVVAFANIPSFGGKLFVVSPLEEIIQIQKEKTQKLQGTLKNVGASGLVYIILLAAFMLLTAIIFFQRGLLGPISVLKKSIENIERGDFSSSVEVKTRDEIGDLATAFNIMAIRLGASRKEIEKYTVELEDKVLERTVELGEERDRLNTIITSMSEGLIVVDKNLKITLINTTAEALLDITKDKLLGKDITKVVPLFTGKEGRDEVSFRDYPIYKAIKSGKMIFSSLEDDFYFQTSSGRKFAVVLAAAPLSGEKFSGAVIMFRDATEEKQLDDAKTSFISVSSHQLRTPLTSMRWFSEMLMAGDAGPISKEQRHFLERIYEGTDRMIGLVNLLLQIARVEAGRVKIEPVPVDLKTVTQGMIVSLKSNLDQKSQKVVIKSDPEQFPIIKMDQEVIWQVIQNLLSNANRYAPEKSTIRISIIKKGDMAEYSVKDEGIGIPKDQQGRIFEKFFRADNALKEVPTGSGLGLSLAKLLVEGWGGKIWFETEEKKGTTFYFTVPLEGMKAKEGEVKISV